MATAVVSAKREINKGIHDEFPLKVIYSDTEPARNYIWGRPNGQYYVWTDCKWVRMELPKCGHEPDPCSNKCCDCVTKDWIEVRLEHFKREVLSAFLRLQDSSCDGTEDLEEYVRTQIGLINKTLGELVQTDSDTDERLDSLEEHDSQNCVTATDPGELEPVESE